MALLPVTAEEWLFAKKQLIQAPDGTKIGHAELPASLNSKHSFIKVNKKIYCLAKGKSSDPVPFQGSMAAVKYAQDEEGKLYIIKISKTQPSIKEQKESAILLDLSISAGANLRPDKNKQYTVLKYLGKNLKEILNNKSAPLSEEKRINIAIQFAYQVYKLHHGLLSSSKSAYAHNDIKPDNITVDEQELVHLIDFGLSTTNPHLKTGIHTGAQIYTALKASQLTGAELDTISLKRSLFLPKKFYTSHGHFKFNDMEYKKKSSLLTQNLLDQHNLNEFINTFAKNGDVPDYSRQVMDPLTICAALINTQEQLGILNSEIRNNRLLCHAIVAVYFSSFPLRLKEIIADEKSYKLAAALHLENTIEHFDSLQIDEELSGKIKQSQDTTIAFTLLKLKQLDLTNYYDLILNSPPTAQIIEKLAKQNKNELIYDLLKHHSDALVNVLLFASQHDLEHRYVEMINNNELLVAIESLPADYDRKRLISLLKNPEISNTQIISFCQDKDKRKAVEIIYDNDPYQFHLSEKQRLDVINNTLNDTEVFTAIINFNNLPLEVDKYYLYEMIKKNKFQAFNILCDAKITSKEAIIKTLSIGESATLILLLKDRGWNSCIPLIFDKQTDLYRFKSLLKSKYASQLTEQMLLDEGMFKALSENIRTEEQSLWLLTLYNEKLFTYQRYTLLKKNYSLFKQVIDVIEAGYSSCINESTLPDTTKSQKEFMLNVVANNYQAFASANKILKGDFQFMLAVTKKDVRALEFADEHLKSNRIFIRDAVRINHKAFNYASDRLKNDPAVKHDIKCGILHYEFTNKNNSRFHIFSAHFNKQDPLKEKYKNKKGDALKTAILKEFKRSLEGKNDEEITQLVNTFKRDIEYKILNTSQGLTSSIFRLQTSSAKAVENIIEKAREIANTATYSNNL